MTAPGPNSPPPGSERLPDEERQGVAKGSDAQSGMQARVPAREAEQPPPQAVSAPTIHGSSPLLHAAIGIALRSLDGSAPLLIRGESGTGRELLARHLHSRSRRAPNPFIVVSTAGMPEPLLEIELFGRAGDIQPNERYRRRGCFELASGGTIFLSDLGRLSFPLHKKLQRLLKERLIDRSDGGEPTYVDVWVIASSKDEAPKKTKSAAEKLEDLFNSVGVVVSLPPLRERGDDKLLLARYFLGYYATTHRRSVPRLTPETEEFIETYAWPGNVRELRHAMERAVLLAKRGEAASPQILRGWP